MKCTRKKQNKQKASSQMEFKQTNSVISYSLSIAQQVFFDKVQVQ